MIGAYIGHGILRPFWPVGVFTDGVLSSAGASTPAFTGETFHDTAISAAGVSTFAFVGNELADTVLNSAGSSAPVFTGIASVDGAFNAAGVSANDFTGQATIEGAFAMAGSAVFTPYSAFRMWGPSDPSSASVSGLIVPTAATLTDDTSTATDATLTRDPWTWP